VGGLLSRAVHAVAEAGGYCRKRRLLKPGSQASMFSHNSIIPMHVTAANLRMSHSSFLRRLHRTPIRTTTGIGTQQDTVLRRLLASSTAT
jgi:hypothetical protein